MRFQYSAGFISYTSLLHIILFITIFRTIHPQEGNNYQIFLKKTSLNVLYAYIDTHNQRLIDKCPGYGSQAISVLKSQCANIKFSDQIRYNRLFQKVVHKEGESKINYIKIFQNAKALAISVVCLLDRPPISRSLLIIEWWYSNPIAGAK